MNKSILFLLHLPPPVTGAGMVGSYVRDSKIINEAFDADYINLASSFSLDRIGKGSFGKIFAVFKIVGKTMRELLKNDYSLCYMTLTAKGPGFYKDFLLVAILKMFGKDIIYHFHNKGVSDSNENGLNGMLYRFVFRNTKSILLSPELYPDIAAYVKEENLYFCPNGIPDEVLPNQELSDVSGICRFLFLSNMMREKGVIVLLQGCKRLKEKGLAFECHFVGAWSDISEIEFRRTVDEFDIAEHIYSHGKQYGADKIGYLKSADVFVLPTYYDCFPLVLLEAMQYSLPVISTFQGGITSIVENGKTGILVPKRKDRELADIMEKLIGDTDLRTRMGEAGRKRYEDCFTLPVFENNLKEILQEAVSENS